MQSVKAPFLAASDPDALEVDIVKIEPNPAVNRASLEVERDEMWSYVASKANQRWLWHAIDRSTGTVLAYVLGRCQEEVFLDLKGLLEPFGISRFFYR